MRSSFPVLCVVAFFLGVASFSGGGSGVQAVDLPVRSIDLPERFVSIEPAPPAPVEGEACVDGSCSPAAASHGGSACGVSGPVRRVVQAQPVRRVVGRVFSRLRGCR